MTVYKPFAILIMVLLLVITIAVQILDNLDRKPVYACYNCICNETLANDDTCPYTCSYCTTSWEGIS
jgi:hypothetical protein